MSWEKFLSWNPQIRWLCMFGVQKEMLEQHSHFWAQKNVIIGMGTWGVVRSLFLKLIERSACGHVGRSARVQWRELKTWEERDDKWQSVTVEEREQSSAWQRLALERISFWRGFSGGSVGKDQPAKQEMPGGTGSILGWGRSLRGGMITHSSFSHLESSMDREAW